MKARGVQGFWEKVGRPVWVRREAEELQEKKRAEQTWQQECARDETGLGQEGLMAQQGGRASEVSKHAQDHRKTHKTTRSVIGRVISFHSPMQVGRGMTRDAWP